MNGAFNFLGLSPEKFTSYAPFRSKERLFWKPFSHVHPMLVVKNSKCMLNQSRPHEIFKEKKSLWLF